jgi:hypothetical protein
VYCRHLFFLKHKEEGDDNLVLLPSLQQNMRENNFKKWREGRELTFKLSLYPLTFGSQFCLLAFALSF